MDAKQINDTFKMAEFYHYTKNDYKTAFDRYRSLARENHIPSMRMVAEFYDEGKGVEKSVLHALHWRERVAKLSDAAIDYYLLGKLWVAEKEALKDTYSGENGKAELEAIKAFTIACEKGYANAFYELALCYKQSGDNDKALECYKQGAAKNEKNSTYALALCYFYGTGVTKNYDLAFENFKKAVDLNNKNANSMLGYCYESGVGTEINYEKAFNCYLVAAELGDSNSQYNLACLYKNGKGTEKNLTEAVKWFTLSAEQGNTYSQYALAYRYLNGEGVHKSNEEYEKWITKSAMAGNINAQFSLGCDYFLSTNGLPKNTVKAEILLKRPAANGNTKAQLYLGKIYKKGVEVQKNKKRAFELFESASYREPEAKYELALCYFNAHGTQRDYYEAIRLFKEASNQGVSKATTFLEKLNEFESKRVEIKYENYDKAFEIIKTLYSKNPYSYSISFWENLISKRNKRGFLGSWDKLDITIKKLTDGNGND